MGTCVAGIIEMTVESYPLFWPHGWPRTKNIIGDQFKTTLAIPTETSIGRATTRSDSKHATLWQCTVLSSPYSSGSCFGYSRKAGCSSLYSLLPVFAGHSSKTRIHYQLTGSL